MENPITILHLEDVEADSVLIQSMIGKGLRSFTYHFVDSEKDYLAALQEQKIDLILSDYQGPGYSGEEALYVAKTHYPHIPFIFVTGKMGEDTAIESLTNGATDYVLKSKLERLVPAIKRVLFESDLMKERSAANDALKRSEEKYRSIFENVQDVFYTTDLNGVIVEISPSILRITGFAREELIGTPVFQLYFNPSDREFFLDAICADIELHDYELRLKAKSGEIKYVSVNARLSKAHQGNPDQINGALRDITDRKLAEETLREHHQLLIKLSEQVPGVIYQYKLFEDGRSCFPFASSGMWGIYEVTPEEVREDATPVFGRLHPEDSQRVADLIFHSARTLEHFYCEFRVVLPVQGLRWRYSDAVPERTPDNGTLWHGIIYDITEHKQLEKELEETNERLKEAQKASKAGTWDWDITKNKFFWSEGFLDLFGMPEDTVPGLEAWKKTVHPEDVDAAGKKIEEAIAEKKELLNDYRIIAPDGSIRWIRATGRAYYDDGLPVRMVGLCIDITSQKLSEAELHDAEWKFKALFEKGPLAVAFHEMIYDAAGKPVDYRFLDVNKHFMELIGMDPRGRKVKEAFPGIENDPFDWIGTYGKVAQTGESIRFEQYFQFNERWYDCAAYQFKPDHFVVAFLEITNRKQIEEKLIQSEHDFRLLTESLDHQVKKRTQELEEVNKELEAFSYSVSHDLHAPLRRIKGMITLFCDTKAQNLTADDIEELDFIYQSAEEMERLINATLSFSKLNRGELKKSTVCTTLMIEEIIRFFDHATAGRNVTYRVHPLPDVQADEELLKQVWTNLISNAIKYTALKPEAIIEIGSESNDEEITFYIKDNGAGFEMDYADRLFRVFQRLHKASEFEGVGVGLANVHRIITRHGGTCRAEGVVDVGATFYFTLPQK
jgi:PAS domain S-box-containing protein